MATLNEENPYVGPRTFTPEEHSKFYGRDRETRELTAVIISNRLVLFYAPSGAGKSSLLNTMIQPALIREGCEVLPTGRVSGYGDEIQVDNIYVYNLLCSLHQAAQMPDGLQNLTLSAFLDNLVCGPDGHFEYDPAYTYSPDAVFKPRVLIIDQFEELLTTNAAHWEERAAFFEQLSHALAYDDLLWIVLTMREDFVASFDPYLHLLPNRLRNRYYMQRLSWNKARDAIRLPAETAGRPFEPEAVQRLVDNLRRMPGGDVAGSDRLEPFVEPVQLQAVCYQMWEKLRDHAGEVITIDDVERFADVDTALTNFYEDTVTQTVAATGVAETDLRSWFDHELITEAGTRNMVFRGEETAGSLPTKVADNVRSQFILRDVVRPGGTWLELVHDSFVAPIIGANHIWQQRQPLIRLAQEWDDAGRPDDLLLGRRRLQKLKEEDWKPLGPLVAAYVTAGNKAQVRAREERHEQELTFQRRLAEQQKALAEQNHSLAVASKEKAYQAKRFAEEQARSARRLRFALAVGGLLLFAALFLANRARIEAMEAGRAREISATEAVHAAQAERIAVAAVTRANQARETTAAEATRAQAESLRANQEKATAETRERVAYQEIAQLIITVTLQTEDFVSLGATATSDRQMMEAIVDELSVTLTPTPFPVPATATPSPTAPPLASSDTSQIAFSGIAAGAPNLLAYHFSNDRLFDGQIELLTNDSLEQQDADWSCDGRLAYVRYDERRDQWALIVRDEETEHTILTDSHRIRRPAWAPDGETLAFDWGVGHNDNHDIYMMTAPRGNSESPSEPLQLTSHVSDDFNPSFSPDGQALTFYSMRDGNREIYVLNLADGEPALRLTNEPADDQRPMWSPNQDEQWIAFDSGRDGNWNIYVMRPDGTQQTQLTTHEEYDWAPAWSADGSRLVFISERTGFGRWQIHVMDFDPNAPEKELEAMTNDGHVFQPLAPHWQPVLNSCQR